MPRKGLRPRKGSGRQLWLGLAFASPWLIGFSVFFGYPLLASLYLSFTHYDLRSRPRWVGTANYRFMVEHDPQFWPAVKNPLWLMAIMVPLQVLFAFGVE